MTEIRDIDWTDVLNSDDPNNAYDIFVTKFTSLYNKHCPIVNIRIKNRNLEKPWLTNGLINAIKKKNNLYKTFIKTKALGDETKYKRYKNKVTYLLRVAEKCYYTELLDKHKNDAKETWKILNKCIKTNTYSSLPSSFLDNNKHLSDAKEIANGFNNFFVNVGPNLAKNIPSCDDKHFTDFINYNSESTIFLNPTNPTEIYDIIRNLKPKTSFGHDGIDMNVIKNSIDYIALPLAHICNKSLISGIFPESMKIAKVVTIYKSGDAQNFTNYRPVSLLSQFSKILEKLFNNRLMDFIDKQNILYSGQYGFRNNLSTSLAIMDLVEEITSAMDNSMYTIGVFIDLQKAFDTIDHELLIRKLHLYGIRGTASTWITSYLSNRKQFVS